MDGVSQPVTYGLAFVLRLRDGNGGVTDNARLTALGLNRLEEVASVAARWRVTLSHLQAGGVAGRSFPSAGKRCRTPEAECPCHRCGGGGGEPLIVSWQPRDGSWHKSITSPPLHICLPAFVYPRPHDIQAFNAVAAVTTLLPAAMSIASA